MGVAYILYNPLAGEKWDAATQMPVLQSLLKEEENILMDMTQLKNCGEFLVGLTDSDKVCLCGGDGTLNRFVNEIGDVPIENDIYYYAMGNGNDFLRDIGGKPGVPVKINEYLQELPIVTVKGRTMRFINGVGYGIDGYCCQEGDRKKAKGKKKINYTAIAIKGLLYGYTPSNATVTVDGITRHYKKVWIAPTMNGRYYGGGMIPTPQQKRLNKKGTVSLMLIHGSGKLKTLIVFPQIFKGTHLRHAEMTAVHTGREIIVEFDRPSPLQVDGETFENVTRYHVRSVKKLPKKKASA